MIILSINKILSFLIIKASKIYKYKKKGQPKVTRGTAPNTLHTRSQPSHTPRQNPIPYPVNTPLSPPLSPGPSWPRTALDVPRCR